MTISGALAKPLLAPHILGAMSALQFSLLPHRSVIAVSGPYRVEFLQGLISNDTTKVAPGAAIWAALLTPQGRFLNDMFVADGANDTLLLETERDRAPALARKLGLYKLRSKVTVEDCSAAMEVAVVFGPGADDLVDAEKRLRALKAIRKRNFEPLAVSFKRIRKILEKANLPPEQQHVHVDLFQEDAERELHATVRKAAGKVGEDKRAGRYQEALEEIAGLRKAIDHFFEKVMVMVEDESVRKNRLALLSEILREFTTIADFSELGGEEGR